MTKALQYGNGWVAQTYLIRHLKHGVLTDCAYAEKPSEEEIQSVCAHHNLPFDMDLIRVVELPVVSGLAHRAEALGQLDEWTPPPLPVGDIGNGFAEVHGELDPENPAKIVSLKVQVKGVGHVTPAPEPAP